MLNVIRQQSIISNLRSFYLYQCNRMSVSEALVVSETKVDQKNNKRCAEEENDENIAKVQKVDVIVKVKKKNYAMLLGYLGKDYFGMQRNPKVKTVEEELVNAMLKVDLIHTADFAILPMIHYQRAARTDKGVSAVRQLVNFRPFNVPVKEELNAVLPDNIRIFGVKRVTKGFNSKTHCFGRTYTYTCPTYAFAFDEEDFHKYSNLEDLDTLREERLKALSTIDGKPFSEFRLSADRLVRLNSILKLFEGTHNFHNFTSRVKPLDPRGKRYIINFTHTEPFVTQNVEFITLELKGQSFMLHQIRKMVGLVIGIMRNVATEDSIQEAFKAEKMDLPIAPSLGLVLNQVHYDKYNLKYGSDGIHESLEWTECDDEVNQFNKDYILKHIITSELTNNSMLDWLVNLAYHSYSTRNENTKD